MKAPRKNDAFNALIDRNKGIIYKVARLYCKDPEDLQDLAQEIAIQLWRSFDNYNEKYKVSTWIYKIALNVSISFYRKETRRKGIDLISSEVLIATTGVKESEETGDNIEQLYLFISQLDVLDKALILLYLEDTSQKEIAEILGLSETNVSTKIYRIKGKLKEKFSRLNKETHGSARL